MLRHALCVFPVLPSLKRNENPLVVPPLLGKEKRKKRSFDKNREKIGSLRILTNKMTLVRILDEFET